MNSLEAIARGVCPKCMGEKVTWVPITGASSWCSCCGGTGVYPPPPGSSGDGRYELTNVAIQVTLTKRKSKYRKPEATAEDKLTEAKKKAKDVAANPNFADGDWAAIRTALGKL